MSELPEWARYLLAIAGVIGTILLGYIASAINRIVTTQVEQNAELKLLRSDVGGISKRLGDLETWKGRLQDEKIAELKRQLERYNDAEISA